MYCQMSRKKSLFTCWHMYHLLYISAPPPKKEEFNSTINKIKYCLVIGN